RLEHRAHRTARDDARTFERRLQQHLPRAEVTEHLVRNRVAHQRDLEEVLLRVLAALANRLGNFVRFAQAHADVAVAVTDDDERGEAEAAGAPPHLRGAGAVWAD